MQHTCACSNANGPHPTAQRAFYAHLKQPPTCSSRHHSPLLFFPRATAHTCKIRCTSASVIGPRGVHSHQCFVHRIARQGMCGSAPIDKAAPSHSAASANIRIVRPLNLVGSKKGSNVRLYLERVLHKNGFGQHCGQPVAWHGHAQGPARSRGEPHSSPLASVSLSIHPPISACRGRS